MDYNYTSLIKKIKVALGLITRKVLTGPIEVSVDLTRRCNLDCIMCWWHTPLLRQTPPLEWLNQEIDYEIFKQLICDFKKIKVKRINLGGQGEPFLYTKLLEAIEFAKRAGIEVALITSGFFFNKDNIKAIFDLKVDWIDVSLQAATEQTYLKTHPKQQRGTFSRIKEQLLLLSQLKKGSHSVIPTVRLIHVICNLNYHEVVKIVELAKDVGVESVGFKRMSVIPETKVLLLNKEQLEGLRDLLDKAEARALELGIDNSISNYRKYILEGLTTGVYTTDFYSLIPCYAGWYSARILENGDVIPCCGCFDIIFGNVNVSSFIDIWSSQEYHRFRQQSIRMDKQELIKRGCKCYSCVDFGSNRGIYRKLHPIKARMLGV
jgi:MoaA/NifB/PqqE/SkfB family radical SAM enzyme